MTNLKTKIATGIATGALLLSTLAPFASADTVLNASGNGAVSDNTINLNNTNSTTVNQNNTSTITNTVNTTSNTGNNTSNFNTGGDSTLQTGNATTSVDITNAANQNQANLSGCGSCSNGNTSIGVVGNGAFSTNNVNDTQRNTTAVNQTNNSTITNTVNTTSNTGRNNASENTGGNTLLQTGSVTTGVSVSNFANSNALTLGSGAGNGNGGDTTLLIGGNGAESDNSIRLVDNNATTLNQTNNSTITNNIRTRSNTGDNTANFNTNGDVTVQTGDVDTGVSIDNMPNFNVADVADCGCLAGGSLLAKEIGNGAFSRNRINATFGNTLTVRENNRSTLRNNVDTVSNTGRNNASENTGDVFGLLFSDPTVMSGSARTTTMVSNDGNVNAYGTTGFTMPTFPSLDLSSLHTSFDLSGLFGMWASMFHV